MLARSSVGSQARNTLPAEVACSGIARPSQLGAGGPWRVDLVDVLEVEAGRHGERDALLDVPAELLEHGPGPADDGVVARSPPRAAPRRNRPRSAGSPVLLDEAVVLERGQQAPGRRAVDAAGPAELLGAQRTVARGDRLEQRGGPVHGLDPLPRGRLYRRICHC